MKASRHIPGVVFHHPAWRQKTVDALPGDKAMQHIRKIHQAPPNNYHREGYHYGINDDGNGKAIQLHGRPDSWDGAHTLGIGNKYLGICVIYDWLGDLPQILIDESAELVAELAELYGFKINNKTILGHRDFMPNKCPGDPLYDALPEIIKKANLILSGGTVKKQIPMPQEQGEGPKEYMPVKKIDVFIDGQRYDGVLVGNDAMISPNEIGKHFKKEVKWEVETDTVFIRNKKKKD